MWPLDGGVAACAAPAGGTLVIVVLLLDGVRVFRCCRVVSSYDGHHTTGWGRRGGCGALANAAMIAHGDWRGWEHMGACENFAAQKVWLQRVAAVAADNLVTSDHDGSSMMSLRMVMMIMMVTQPGGLLMHWAWWRLLMPHRWDMLVF